MGRTIPSFRMALAMEKEEWKPFRNALSQSERKMFDEMWDIPKLYVSACSNSVQLVPLHPIFISILFHYYKELKECISAVKELEEGQVNHSKKREEEECLTIKEEEEKEVEKMQEIPITTTTSLDGFLIENNEI
jgi:hypothetical protein